MQSEKREMPEEEGILFGSFVCLFVLECLGLLFFSDSLLCEYYWYTKGFVAGPGFSKICSRL
jgi:hypothetical protein